MVQLPYVKQKGYITLMSILIVGAVGLAIASSLLLFGINSSRSSLAFEQSKEAKALASACVEEALGEIRDNTSFSGSGNLSLGLGSCSYTVINLGGQSREIRSTGTMKAIVRKVRVTIDAINPTINVTSWQEVADF